MTELRRRTDPAPLRLFLLAVVVLALLASVLVPLAVHPSPMGTTRAPFLSARNRPAHPGETSAQVTLEGSIPSEVAAGVAVPLDWEAFNASLLPIPTYAVSVNLTVTDLTSGFGEPAWTNSTVAGPLVGADDNSTFLVPSAAWHNGWLNLSVTFRASASLLVHLVGPALSTPASAATLEVLPNFAELLLYHPGPYGPSASSRTNETYWRVSDRFGDPAPGAVLTVQSESGAWMNDVDVPVAPAPGGGTGAWVNYSLPGNGSGSVEVRDAAGAVVEGPIDVPAVVLPTNVSNASSAAPVLPESPVLLGLAALVILAGVVGIVALLGGGRPKEPGVPSGPEDDLRRLAEGRETVVELVRRKGPLSIRELEAAWEPPPAPPAVADWVASLVTDGTLTATIGEEGTARFALAARAGTEPLVTLDEAELERGIARRDAAVDENDEPGAPPS